MVKHGFKPRQASPAVLALGEEDKKELVVKVILDYIEILRACLKQQNKTRQYQHLLVCYISHSLLANIECSIKCRWPSSGV